MVLQNVPIGDIGAHHYTTGWDSWRVGSRHYWLRFRGLISVLTPNILLMGTPWWWEYIPIRVSFPETIAVNSVHFFVWTSIFLSAILALLFSYGRGRARRSIVIKECLHALSHEMRDSLCNLLQRTNCPLGGAIVSHETELLFQSSNSISDKVARYYSALIGDNSVSTVIRLVTDFPFDGNDNTFFSVVGRAGAQDPRRLERSEPIPSNEGLPKLLQSDAVGVNGVIYIHDLQKAIIHNIYKQTKNDRDFPSDYNCLIAVPLNGWNGTTKTLIGILTIGGRNPKKLLRVEHIDILKAIGDRLAEFYSSVVSTLLQKQGNIT